MNENEQQQLHPATVAQEFMKRTDMKGGEVEVYAQTFNWLAQIAGGDVVCIPKDDFQAMVDEMAELRDETSAEEPD
jgi:hypothetical protein